MSCTYGNCNDANCVQGSDTDVNGNPCDDSSCAPCGSIAVTGGVPATTVAPNPSIPAAGSNVSALSSMTSALGQWGATIAGIATGQPVVSGPSGVRTGYAAISPGQAVTGSPGTMMLLLIVVVVVLVAFSERK